MSKCPNCEKPLIKKWNKFCSSSCANSYNNRKRKHSPETKKKIGMSTRNRIKNVGFKKSEISFCLNCKQGFFIFSDITKCKRKTCTSYCYKEYKSKQQTKNLKENRSHIIGRKQPSYMEKSFKIWLIKHGLENNLKGFLSEVHFVNKQTKRNGWIDFLFPRLKLIIELDGTQHKLTTTLDQARDEYLLTRGWKTIRISHYDYIKKYKIGYIKNILGLK